MPWSAIRRFGYLGAALAGLVAAVGAVVDLERLTTGALGLGLAGLALASMASSRALHGLQRRGVREARTAARKAGDAVMVARDVPSRVTQPLRTALDGAEKRLAHRSDLVQRQVTENAWLQHEAMSEARRTGVGVAALGDTVRGDVTKRLASLTKKDSLADKTYRRTFTLATGFEATPSTVVELERLHRQLVTVDRPMPSLGGWAATVPTISLLTDTILHTPSVRTIVECGSGGSTVWSALALARRGTGGHVYSLDHEEVFAAQTREFLAMHEVDALATVLDHPLVPTTVGGATSPWYDVTALADVGEIDLLFVDGPPVTTSDHAREPAYPVFAERLSDGALVVLDDTDRAVERSIVERWLALEIPGRSIHVLRAVGRSTVLEVRHTSV